MLKSSGQNESNKRTVRKKRVLPQNANIPIQTVSPLPMNAFTDHNESAEKPAQLQESDYTQGDQAHVLPKQEKPPGHEGIAELTMGINGEEKNDAQKLTNEQIRDAYFTVARFNKALILE